MSHDCRRARVRGVAGVFAAGVAAVRLLGIFFGDTVAASCTHMIKEMIRQMKAISTSFDGRTTKKGNWRSKSWEISPIVFLSFLLLSFSTAPFLALQEFCVGWAIQQ